MIICRGTNDTDGRTNGQLFTSLFRDKLSLQGARIGIEQHVWKRMKRFWSACKQSRFILMRLHHMLWCGVIGEDYDEFEGIRTSTCLTFWDQAYDDFLFFYDFPMGYMRLMISQCYPVGFGYILYWMVHNDDDFVQVFSKWGFLGLYFSVQSNTVSWALVSRIGLRGVFDGTVDVLNGTVL